MASTTIQPPRTNAATRAAPSLRVLVVLTLIVAIGHWLTLGGGLSFWPGLSSPSTSEIGALPTPHPSSSDASTAETPGLEARALPAPVTSSTVRWIVPVPPPPPPPPVVTEPRPPKVVARATTPAVPEPAPPPPPPEPVPEPEPVPVEPVVEAVKAPEPVPTVTEPPQAVATELPAVPALELAAASATTGPPASAKAASGPPISPASLPPNATLPYKVEGSAKGFNYRADGQLAWQHSDSAYQAELSVSAFLLGSYVQRSVGNVTPQGLAPERFSDRRRSNEKAAHFERSTGRIRYSNNAPDSALMPGAQDQLSITLQLGALLNDRPQISEGQMLNAPVSSTGTSEVWRFRVGPVSSLQLPAGEVSARLLTREPRQPYDKTVQLWLAPSLGNLPVRIRLTEHNGDFMDLRLETMPKIATSVGVTPTEMAVP